MKKEIKEKFPSWCNDTNTKYNLMLSDDLDSLFSCIVLENLFGYKIKYFYNFNMMYTTKDIEKQSSIAVDVDLTYGRCWGNHVTLDNEYSANLNTIQGIGEYDYYYKKYFGSTLLTILSYYDVDLSILTEEQKMVLLAIDSTYLGYKNPKYRHIAEYWIKDVLEFNELYEVLKRHTQEEFKDIIKKYNLDSKIIVNHDGQLNTSIKLDKLKELFPYLPFSLPKNKFEVYRKFQVIQSNQVTHIDVFSCARTYKNAFRYSI